MKIRTVALIFVFSITSNNYAVAEGRHGHYNNHYRGHGYYKNNYRDHGYYSYGPRRYDVPRRHYDYYDRGGDYWVGGLVVGRDLDATIANTYNNEPRYSNYNKRVFVYPNPANNDVQPSYVLYPNGICYVVNAANNGNLVLSPVSTGNCQ